ncbi:TRAP transporter small permease [Chloroflexota bacterium]
MRKLTAIFDKIIDSSAVLSAIIIVFLMLGVTVQIVLRYFFNNPILGVVELSGIAVLYALFLGTAWVLRNEKHVVLDIVIEKLNPRNQHLINMINSIVCAIMCLILIWYATQMTWMRFESGLYLKWYLKILDGYSLLIIPLGSTLLFIQFLRRAYGYLQKWKMGTPIINDVKTITDVM